MIKRKNNGHTWWGGVYTRQIMYPDPTQKTGLALNDLSGENRWPDFPCMNDGCARIPAVGTKVI
ncbi:hypothetical protein [Spirosoma aerophilum]